VIREWGIYDVEDLKGRAIPLPASYIIDVSGLIVWHHIGMSTRDRPDPAEFIDQLESLKK
jgi:peroxiredoxin